MRVHPIFALGDRTGPPVAWRPRVNGDDIGHVQMTEPPVVEPQHQLELVAPHEDLRVVAVELLKRSAAYQHRAAPKAEQAGQVLVDVEAVCGVARARHSERDEIGVVALRLRDSPAETVRRQVAVVVEGQDVVAAGVGETVVPPAHAAVRRPLDQARLGELGLDHLRGAVARGVVHDDHVQRAPVVVEPLQRPGQAQPEVVAPVVGEEDDRGSRWRHANARAV